MEQWVKIVVALVAGVAFIWMIINVMRSLI